MYAILIKDKSGLYRFLNVKKEIMEETTTTVTDSETSEVKNEVTLVGTGNFETVRFETESREELETKCVELMGTYNKNQFIPVNTEPFEMDLIWNSEKESESV